MAKETLEALLSLDELKISTPAAQCVADVTRQVLSARDKLSHVDLLILKLKAKYGRMLKTVARCKLAATRRERLWVKFHRFSIKDGMELCSQCEKRLGISGPDSFWQLIMEKEFLKSLKLSELSRSSAVSSSSADSPPVKTLTFVEENAVRYTAGYVIRKLESKYSRTKHEQNSIECLRAIREMGGKLSEQSSQSQSTQWTRLINRGGLYLVNDAVYNLFVAIEHIADEQLTSIFNQRGKGIEKVKKDKLSWICDNDDVQEMWSMVSPSTIESDDARRSLLKEIVHLWITVRGHSKAKMIKEDYKKAKKETVKGKHSLRKDLKKATCSAEDNK